LKIGFFVGFGIASDCSGSICADIANNFAHRTGRPGGMVGSRNLGAVSSGVDRIGEICFYSKVK